MTITSPKLLMRLASKKALIIEDKRGGCVTYAAYPGGDRRCRPISWISKDVFQTWLGSGVITADGKGWSVVPSAQSRGQISADNPHGRAHRTMETQTLRGDDGFYRPAQVNLNTRSALRVLGLRRDSSGEAFLTAQELAAGEKFANDYARANFGKAQTQDYAHAGADISRVNTAENAAITAIDSRAQVNAAIEYVGPGLSRAVIAICGQEIGLEQMEKNEGWTRRSGRTVLKLGLQRLAEFYGTTAGLYTPGARAYADKARASL